jgi:hypothetical protein
MDVQAKLAVFELNVPTTISKWRDMTFACLVDVCSPLPSLFGNSQWSYNRDNKYALFSYTGLSKYVKSNTGRLQLASSTKPFVVSHYRSKKVSEATESTTCVNNGLNYAMYDSKKDKWASDMLDRCELCKLCTLQLPASYEALQFALDATTHTSNEVIAKQSTCPRHLTLHEFYSFATLRSGYRLQWRNVARELVTGILNFNREETHLLILQAIWQAGPSSASSSCRESHVDLEEEEFGLTLLSVLKENITNVEENWQAVVAVRTFVAVVARLLSVSPHNSVHQGCYRFLKKARGVALSWTRELTQLLHDDRDAEHLESLNTHTLEIALTCYGTFDVEIRHVPGLLASDDDVGVLTECSMVIHDRCPAVPDELPKSITMLLGRYWRVRHLLEPIIREKILAKCDGVNMAIRNLWDGYRPGGNWTALKSPNERWLRTKTSDTSGHRSTIVQYNVLDGSLLVNGSPLSRLPRSYELHETYRRLFKEVIRFLVREVNELTCFC